MSSQTLPRVDGETALVPLDSQGRLQARMTAHSVAGPDGPVPCWTLLTQGLAGARELAVTVRRDRGAELRPLLQFFVALHQLGEGGQLASVGSQTTIGPGSGLLGRGRFFTILYAAPQPLAGVAGSGDALTGILLDADEAARLYHSGPQRILARLGAQNRFFPTTPWADPTRPSVIDPAAEAAGAFEGTGKLFVAGLAVTLAKEGTAPVRVDSLEISFTPQDAARLCQVRAQPTPIEVIRLLAGRRHHEDAILVYTPGAPPSAISASASMERLALNALVVARGESDRAGLVEDTAVLLLRQDSWDRVWEAFERAEPAELQTDGDLRLVRLCPTQPAQPNDPVADLREIILLVPETVVAERIGVEPLAHAVQALMGELRAHCLRERPPERLLIVEVGYEADGKTTFQYASEPGPLEAAWLRGLDDGLRALPAPPARHGAVRFQLKVDLSCARYAVH